MRLAGTYLRVTGQDCAAYVDEYEDFITDLVINSRDSSTVDLPKQRRKYSVLATYQLTKEDFDTDSRCAIDLLKYMTFFHADGVYFELLAAGMKHELRWTTRVLRSNTHFTQMFSKLQRYGLAGQDRQSRLYRVEPGGLYKYLAKHLRFKDDKQPFSYPIRCIARCYQKLEHSELGSNIGRLAKHAIHITDPRSEKRWKRMSFDTQTVVQVAGIGEPLRRWGEPERAEQRLKHLIAEVRQKDELYDPCIEARSMLALGQVYKDQGRYNRALELLAATEKALTAHPQASLTDIVRVKVEVASIYVLLGKGGAMELLSVALNQMRTRPDYVGHILLYHDIDSGFADALIQLGRHDKAEDKYLDAIDKNLEALGEDNPAIIATKVKVATVCLKQRKFEIAHRYCNEALQAALKVYGKEHSRTLDIVEHLAAVLQAQRKRRDLKELQERFGLAQLSDEEPEQALPHSRLEPRASGPQMQYSYTPYSRSAATRVAQCAELSSYQSWGTTSPTELRSYAELDTTSQQNAAPPTTRRGYTEFDFPTPNNTARGTNNRWLAELEAHTSIRAKPAQRSRYSELE